MKYDYEVIKKKLYKERLGETKGATKQKWLKEKVGKFAEKFGFKEKDVISEIESDEIVAANFIKDPAKQNFYQNQALEFLKFMGIVEKAELLSSSGKNAWYVKDGVLGHKRDAAKTIKSIDFRIKLKTGEIIWASHKYTKEDGGAQDNQKNDLMIFVKNARKYTGEDIMMVIADGDYYNAGRVADFKREARGKVVICNMENFEKVVKEEIEKKNV